MKAEQLRDLSIEDLAQKERSLKKELFELNYQRRLGIVEKPAKFGLIKKDIARIQTVLKEREDKK